MNMEESLFIWNLEDWSFPQNIRTLIFSKAFSPFLFGAVSDFDSYNQNLTISIALIFESSWPISSSFIYLTFFSVIASSSACSTFGINFFSWACEVVSWPPYQTHRSCQLWVLTWCSKFLREPWELVFPPHVTLKYITLAVCFDPIEHNPLSQSIFVPH